MKRIPFIPYRLAIGLLLLLLLAACERPVPREDTPDQPAVVEPTLAPIQIPTAIPTPTPTGPVLPDSGESEDQTTPEDGDGSGDGTTTPDPGESPDETAPNPTSHTVQAGDTLGHIAELYDIAFDDLVAANGITNVDVLDIGQVLVIPSEGSVATEPSEPEQPAEPPVPSDGEERIHTVTAGENLFRIGLVYGFTIDELASYNGIVDPTRLEIGQIIRIPPGN